MIKNRESESGYFLPNTGFFPMHAEIAVGRTISCISLRSTRHEVYPVVTSAALSATFLNFKYALRQLKGGF
jgi:hypothetical protein